MFYRIGDFLLNLNLNSFHIFQASSQQQAHLYASDIAGASVFTGTLEEVEAKLEDIQEAIRDCGNSVYGITVEPEPEPEPEEVVETEDGDGAEEEE